MPKFDPSRRRLGLAALAGMALLAAPASRTAVAATGSATAPNPGPPDAATPAELTRHLPTARLWGNGSFRFFGLRIYDLHLWAAPGFAAIDYAQHPFALSLLYARRFSGADIASRSIQEMRRIETIAPDQASRWLSDMGQAFPDVREGDRLTGLNQPGQAARFFHNGQPTRAIEGAAFARLFFGIWLAPQTSEPGLRQQLLAGRT